MSVFEEEDNQTIKNLAITGGAFFALTVFLIVLAGLLT